MNDLRTAAQQALEALETCDAAHLSDGGQQWYDEKLVEPAITALRAALAQPQEPVSVTDLQRALVETDLIDPDAIDDPEGYDAGSTVAQIDELHRLLFQSHPPAQPVQEPQCNPNPKAQHGFLRNARERREWARAVEAAEAALAEPPKPVPLKRGTTGRCTRKVCECEMEGLGLECIYLEPVIDGYPLWSGMPKAEPVQEPVLTVDALRVEFERRYRGKLGITRVEGGAYLSPAIETEWQQFVRKYTAPPQRKPLSGIEVERLLEQVIGSLPVARKLIRAVEAAHGIG